MTSAQTTGPRATGSSGSSPSIVLLTLDNAEFYDDLYQGFTKLLESKANVERVTTSQHANAIFNRNPKPTAILAADESLTASTRTHLVQEALKYINSGGILIFMGLFSSLTRPPSMDALFSNLGVPWRSGDYHRTAFTLNPTNTNLNTAGLASSYSQKALHVKNVTPSDAVYLPSGDSRIESVVFAPMRVSDLRQAPAALMRLRQGKLGYIGDVNNEQETPAVILAMCGL